MILCFQNLIEIKNDSKLNILELSFNNYKRWNIKTLAEPGVNHSKSNYRFRLFGDKEKPHPRAIRPGIYWEENETEKNNANNMSDSRVYIKQ